MLIKGIRVELDKIPTMPMEKVLYILGTSNHQTARVDLETLYKEMSTKYQNRVGRRPGSVLSIPAARNKKCRILKNLRLGKITIDNAKSMWYDDPMLQTVLTMEEIENGICKGKLITEE